MHVIQYGLFWHFIQAQEATQVSQMAFKCWKLEHINYYENGEPQSYFTFYY